MDGFLQGLRSLAATTFALFLVFSFLGNASSAPQRLLERRNWTPQAMLYLKGARTLETLRSSRTAIKEGPRGHLRPSPGWRAFRARRVLSRACLAFAEGRRFISDQSRRKDLSDRLPPERRSPNALLLTLPEASALLLASLQKPQEAGEENFDRTRFLDDSLLNW